MKNEMNKINIYVVMLFCVALLTFTNTIKVNAAKMSKADKKAFAGILKDGMKSDGYVCVTGETIYNAFFYVYDINGDGRKDVIVSGGTGQLSMGSSEIYMFADGESKVISIIGYLKGVSSKGANFVDEFQQGAGAERIYSRTAYKFDKHANITAKYTYHTITQYFDRSSGKIYKKGKVLSKGYSDGRGNKVSKSVYKKTLKQTNKKKNVKMQFLTKVNIKKYLK